MNRVIIVYGQIGAGKTTYSIKISNEIKAIKFSIDPWMQTLFSKDLTALDFDWMMERVERCSAQMWEVAEQMFQFMEPLFKQPSDGELHNGSVINASSSSKE